MHKSYQFRLEVTTERAKILTNISGSYRFVYNHFLAIQKDLYEHRNAVRNEDIKFLSYVKTAAMLTELKREEKTSWLKESPAQVLQQSLMDLSVDLVAWMNGEKGFPRFKKKGVHDTFKLSDGFKIDEQTARILLPNIGWIRYRKSRETKGTIRSLTVSREDKHWYVSILTQQEEQAFHPKDSSVGIDLGVKHFATLSTGEHINVPDLTKYEKRITKLQKQLSHKQKDTNNFNKTKQLLDNAQLKLQRAKLDFIHKVSANINKRHS